MKKIFLSLIFLSLNLLAVNVLILNSYQETLPWTEIQSNNIIQNLEKIKNKKIKIYVEFMDTKLFRLTPKRENNLLRYYQDKYDNISFDIIFTTDDNALNFVRKHKNINIFKDAKVFFSGVNDISLQKTLDKNIYAGVFEMKDPVSNLSLARHAVGNLKTLYLISDATLTGEKEVELYKSKLSKFKNINFVYLSSKNIDDILGKLDNYDKNSAMMLVTFTSFTRGGKHISYEEALTLLGSKYKNPMLIHTNTYINLNNTNIIGGDCTDAKEQGLISSFKAKEYLDGNKMNEIGFLLNGGNKTYFNVKNLKKYGLSVDDFNIKDPILVGKPNAFYQIYKQWIFLFAAIIFLIIVFMFVLGRKNIALKKALENFEILAETSFGAIAIYDKQQKIKYANQRLYDLTKYLPEEILNQDAFRLIYPDDLDIVKKNIKLKNTEPYDVRIMKKDKSFFYALLKGKDIVFNGENMRIVTAIDITERKIQEHKIEEINKGLKQKIKDALNQNSQQLRLLQQQSKLASMGEMIGAIAHQWRQPLNALNINIQNLDDDFEDGLIDRDFLDNFINKNSKIINFMSKTIDDFRNFYRVDKVKKDFYVKKAIRDVLSIQAVQLKEHNIKILLTGDDKLIKGYESEFKQVILNLINNAKDALIESNIKNPKINIEILGNRLLIKDNGGGIPSDVLNRIFEPYFTTKEQGQGTGLGLYMSKMIIEDNMHGKLSVWNERDWAVFEIITNLNTL